jgi:hypothetical protein
VNGAPIGTEPGDKVLAGMRQMPKGEVCLPTGERGRQGLVESGSDDERRRTAASHSPRARSEL